MTGSAAEFRRALRQAFGDAATDTEGGIRLTADGARLHFSIGEETPLCLGALRLERLRIEVRIEGDEAAACCLLARADRATQRGGG
jgi:hypothetical protein